MRKQPAFSCPAALPLLSLSLCLSGCIIAPQSAKNVSTAASPKVPTPAQRGAFSGIPQVIDHYFALNPDCTSVGMTTVVIDRAPSHGTLSTRNDVYSYPGYPTSNQRYECNKKKLPSVELTYTPDKTFVGTDTFTVRRVTTNGYLNIDEFVVSVVPLRSVDSGAGTP